MAFLSTRGDSPPADLASALLRGLAPDGGLYVPDSIEPAAPIPLDELRGASMAETAEIVLAPFLQEVPEADRRRLLADALDFPVPVVELRAGVRILELFHGPTLAFKDIGARFLARFLAYFQGGSERPLTVLVATSGDTGGAVARAFLGVPSTRVVVHYPRGQVSALQEKQITTLGENVEALAVEGSFDDCQALVKGAFANHELRHRLLLTSANSINIGRLLPQMIYYFHAWGQLPPSSAAPYFVTPSGNFGNLTAGLLAKTLGLPCAGFAAATNVNDSVPRYLAGDPFAPRPSRRTLSNAMDVGAPSNFDRILWLYGGDRQALVRDLHGSRHDDQATREAIRQIYGEHGYILDPHTAVGYLGLLAARREVGERVINGIVLATAHPVKFREHVEPLLGHEIPVPERLARYLDRPSLARPLAVDAAAFARILLGG